MVKKIRNKWADIPLAVKVSVAYAVCSILQKCISFITLPLFTRILSTEEYGQYTVYQSWSSIIAIFITLNLAFGSFSTAMIKFEKKRDEYISSIQGIYLLLAAVFFLIYLPFRNTFNKWFELPTFIIVIMVFEIITTNAISLWSGKLRFEFKYKSVIFVTLLTSIFGPLLSYFLVINSDQKGFARIIGYALVSIVIGGVIFLDNFRNGKKLFNKGFWKYAFSFNIPLLAYYLSQMIFNQSDRLMISYFTGISDAALYGVAYNLAMVLNFILNAINNSYIPWLYEKIKEENCKDNRKIANLLSIFIAVLILMIIWFAPELINILASEKYAAAVYVVPPVAMSLLLLFYSQLFINIEFYYEEKKLLVWNSIGAALLNIILNAILIPIYGFVAAGYTTLFSYVIFAVCNFYGLKKTIGDKLYEIFDIKMLIIIFIIFAIFSFVGLFLYKYFVIRLIILGFAVLVLFIERKKMVSIYKTIKMRASK